ncbi:uncharacterized protein N7487_011021 [Penicillium crustosum]|uniref:uncharacterized protein n=1 Tax=Penicillium crustosum TaxID=36656 RepID=UPI00239DCF89|nr:uncharacterized protein N7487_011021 [Penicillium crustosum]KAJ5393380.1 hypothetical protein N7487_011021 [Penicillium crustosum]
MASMASAISFGYSNNSGFQMGVNYGEVTNHFHMPIEEMKETNTRPSLFGLGGIGKTQVALQLARWVKAHVPDCSIFWAPALSLESFEQACSQIAKELQTHQNDGESAMESVQR